MSDPSQPDQRQDPLAISADRPRRANRIRRVLALALLGATLAMVVVQITRMVRHEAAVAIQLDPSLLPSLRQLELSVLADGSDDPPLYVTLFRFDADHRPEARLEHKFQLTNGRYEIQIVLRAEPDSQPLVVSRPLEVAGDVQIRYRLP